MDAATDVCFLGGVGVPEVLLSDPERFGGVRRRDLRCGRLILRGGRVEGLVAETDAGPPERPVLPRLTEAHVHLDTCHSVERCKDVGGDLGAAMAAQLRDKALWTAEDIYCRARRGVQELIVARCETVRSHADWAMGADQPEAPLAWEVLGALSEEAATVRVILQRASRTSIDDMSDPQRADAVARRVARDGGVLGSFLLHHDNRRDGLEVLFACTERYGLPLEFHVDEGLDPGLDGLELIAGVGGAVGFSGPVLCGHASSLASRSDDDVRRIADKLARRGFAVATLPSTNLYLHGHRDGTHDRRGITRLRELAERGVDIVVGTDNVRDAITEVTLRTVPIRDWVGCMVGFADDAACHAAGYALASAPQDEIARKLCSTVDARICDGFPRLDAHVPKAQHLLVSLVPREHQDAFRTRMTAHGGTFHLAMDETERQALKLPHVLEFAYNHSTLQVLKSNRSATYQQIGVPDPSDTDRVEAMRIRQGDDVWPHHEFTRAGGVIHAAALPIVWFKSAKRLAEINATHAADGFTVYDAHVNNIEGNHMQPDHRHRAWKKRMAPKGLLNPGKSRMWQEVRHLSPHDIEALGTSKTP